MGRRIDRRRPVLGLRIRLGAGVALQAPFGGGAENLYKTVTYGRIAGTRSSRERAVKLYVRYGGKATAMVRGLGYSKGWKKLVDWISLISPLAGTALCNRNRPSVRWWAFLSAPVCPARRASLVAAVPALVTGVLLPCLCCSISSHVSLRVRPRGVCPRGHRRV